MQNFTSSQKNVGTGGICYNTHQIHIRNLIQKSPGTHAKKLRGNLIQYSSDTLAKF